MVVHLSALTEIALVLIASAIVGYLSIRLRQPLVTGFIAVGIIFGPSGLRWVQSTDQIHLFAQIGLAILLFVVGLRLDLHLIRTMGMIALAAGVAQVVATAVFGYVIAYALGMNATTSLYIALALTFSSTIIIVKLLSDKKETESLHGRISLGLLIVQDILVVLAMIALSALGGKQSQSPMIEFAMVAAKGAGLIFGIWLLSRYVIPATLHRLAQNAELLVLCAIAWALGVSAVTSLLGFSTEVGAFLAGVSLASTEYRDLLGARLVTLRDFLLLFFFVDLGTKLNLGAVGSYIYVAILISLFVLVGKPLIVMAVLGALGYRKRTSFLTGVSMGQISEFSLILVAMGLSLGHIRPEIAGIITLVALISIGLSTHMIISAADLYTRLSPYLKVFERRDPLREASQTAISEMQGGVDAILFGLGRYGGIIAQELSSRGRKIIGVDFDPQVVREWNAKGVPTVFGDSEDPEFLPTLPLAASRWTVNSVRDINASRKLISGLKHDGYSGNMAFTASAKDDIDQLKELGADLVFYPFEDAAVQAVDLMIEREREIERKHMDKAISEMSDHYVLCGYGRMGQQIAKDFISAHIPFVVVESNPKQLPKLEEQGILHVVGKASQDEVLTQAGIKRAKGLIAVNPTDEDNVFIVLTARVLNPDLTIIARSILQENEDKLKRAGADRVMSPYTLGGHLMAAAVTKPDAIDVANLLLDAEQEDIVVGRVAVSAGSNAIGKTLGGIDLWRTNGVKILAIRRRGVLIANPSSDSAIETGDELVVMGSHEQVEAVKAVLD